MQCKGEKVELKVELLSCPDFDQRPGHFALGDGKE